MPVAVFTDGWQYHKHIVAEDLAKRMAVAKSGRFAVWTLTWDDIDAALRAEPAPDSTAWDELLLGPADQVSRSTTWMETLIACADIAH